MLSIGKIALGQHRYYEQQVARGRDDYYAGRGEAPGEWVGSGAKALRLSGRVSSDDFGARVAGLDPREPGVRLRSSERDPKVAALDLTFSAPKSVSVLAAVGSDELARELILAHERALRAALAYLEDTAVEVRRGHDGKLVHAGEGLIAAAYRHRMSRALDPQLHTHVVAANMTRGPDRRYTALHGAPLYRAAKTAGYLYQSHLRALVIDRTGLQWGPVRKGAAELAAVPEVVLKEFSKRRHEMLRAAERGGIGLDSKAAGEKAAIATRDRKRYGVDTHTWREEVRARAAELGLGSREVRQALDVGQKARRENNSRRRLDERALGDALVGPRGLTERANSFDEHDVVQQFAAAAPRGESAQAIREQAERFLAREDVLPTIDGAFTTAELVACERGLMAAAIGRAREGVGVLDDHAVVRALRNGQQGLTRGQEAVVREVVTSGRGVEVIEALAGTGKTYLAGVMRELYELAGHAVVGVAPTARAARELEEHSISAGTLDRLLIDLEQLGGELPRSCIVVFDEAGMAPTRSSGRLLEAAGRAGAKVIAIGDPGQLASVQAGGWLGLLARELGSPRLTEVMRQRDSAERRALSALHDGRPARYLQWAQRAGRIETFSEQSRACDHAIQEWARASGQVRPSQAVIIARDNDARAELNDAARELWRALGLLGDEHSYGPVCVAVGDRVICRRNDSTLDLDNGTRGTVRHVDEDRIVIETDSCLIRELPAGYVAEHVEHAYALTGHGMQGATVESAIVVASPSDLTAGWSYTALSRARGTTRLLIHQEQVLRERTDVAPGERHAVRREELLARATRRMLERDSQELATAQLGRAGHADDRALGLARQVSEQVLQEQAAAHAELGTRPRGREALDAMREELGRLRAQRSALPVHKLTQLGDVEARIAGLERQRDRVAQALAAVADAPQRRRGRAGDPTEIGRARLSAALTAHQRALDEARAQRTRIERDLGDREQVRSERDGLDRAIDQLSRRVSELGKGELEVSRSRRERDPEREVQRVGHELGLGD